MRVKMSKQPSPAPTAGAVGPCPTVIQIVGRPGTGSLSSTIAPPDHPSFGQAGYMSHQGSNHLSSTEVCKELVNMRQCYLSHLYLNLS